MVPPAEKVSEKKDTPVYQHVGLGYLAAVLQKNNIAIDIINSKLERLNFAQTLKRIIDCRPDIIGFSAMTHEIEMAAKLAASSKEYLPKVFTVVGGVHVTALPIETLKQYFYFDAAVTGEGEYSFLDLVNNLEQKNFDFSQLKGVVYRDGQKINFAKPAEKINDLDTLPFPAWHLFPQACEYIILTARGCPFSCIFCMQASGRVVRKRSEKNVVQEIEHVLSQKPPKWFRFHDETFTLDKKRVFAICNEIIQSGLNKKIRWSATTRVDSIDKETLLKMKEAGCKHIEFGIESGDQKMLDSMQKRITLQQAINAIELAKNLGFHTEGAFILGHPHETLQSAYRTICFGAKLNPDLIQLGIMVPYPGTEVARLAARGEGGYKVISHNWSDYNKQLGRALELENLSRTDLEKLQLLGYLKLFIFNNRFSDLLRFLWNYKREGLSFLRNYFKKHKNKSSSKMSLLLMFKLLVNKSEDLVF